MPIWQRGVDGQGDHRGLCCEERPCGSLGNESVSPRKLLSTPATWCTCQVTRVVNCAGAVCAKQRGKGKGLIGDARKGGGCEMFAGGGAGVWGKAQWPNEPISPQDQRGQCERSRVAIIGVWGRARRSARVPKHRQACRVGIRWAMPTLRGRSAPGGAIVLGRRIA